MTVAARFPILLFDFDGTLVDSAGEIGAALNLLLAEADRPPVTVEQTRTFVGDGAARLVERGFAAGGLALDAKHLSAQVNRYLEIYGRMPADPETLYPGVRETLARLDADGHRLALCTNKPEAISRVLLEGLGIGRLFRAVVGGDTLATRKPAPEPLLHAVRLLGGTPDGAVMVGDNGNDVQAARAAGMPVVAVSYGYPRMRPEELGADMLIDRFADLPAALARLAGQG